MTRLSAAVFALCALLAGCSTTTPSAPPTAITITPADDLLVAKAALTFKAIGSFADGSTRSVDATWLTDNPAVATASAGGVVTGVGAGSTTLVATAEGRTGWRVLRVVPDFTGSWNGQYQITACSADDPRTCGRGYPGGLTNAMTLTLTQARDIVSGTLTFVDQPPGTIASTIAGLVSGPIQLAGGLVLQGNLTRLFADGSTDRGPTLFDWSTIVNPAGSSMTGHFTQIFQASLSGQLPIRVQSNIVLSRTSR